jgi:hypothetical protein
VKLVRQTLIAAVIGTLAAPASAQWQQPPPQQPAAPQAPAPQAPAPQAPAPQAPAQQAPLPPLYPMPPPQPVSMSGMPQVILPPLPVPGEQETVARLDQAKASDAGRKLEWVWIDVHGGFEQLGLQTFSGDAAFTGGVLPTSSSGAVTGVGVGARLLFLTLLVRARMGIGSIGHLYRVGAEVGFHVPFGRVEPHVELGAGYAIFGKVNDGGTGGTIQGGYGRVGAGVDYFVAPVVSIGAGLSAELLGLVRGGASSIGGSIAATGVVGLHF